MKIKILWGFHGDAELLKNGTGKAKAGEVYSVTAEYGHALVGKGLAKEVTGEGATDSQAKADAEAKEKADAEAKAKADADAKAKKPDTTKQTGPKENK